VLVGTDGEALQSIDNGATFNNITSTISNIELWGFGSAFKSDMLAAGCNHGPLSIRTFDGNGGWFNWGGADQQNTDINPLDSSHVISRGYDAYILSRTGPQTFVSASGEVDAGREDWFNNLTYHPNIYSTIISHTAGNFPKPEQGTPTGQHLIWRNSLIRSTNNGLTITSTVHTFSDRLMREKICMLDTNRIYAIVSPTNNTLWKTTDGGVNWTDITPSTTVTGTGVRNMSDIAVSDVNPNEIWVSYSGVQNTCKLLHSTDGGATYTNLTTAVLTSSPITRIVFQRGTDGGVYVGNKSGVFYRSNTMNEWQMLGNGLPMTDVRNMFINYWKGKLLIGTSRGAWDHDLYEHSATKAQISVDKRIAPCSQPVKFRDYSVLKSGATVSYSWSFPGGTPSSSTLENPSVTYANQGSYDVSLTVTDEYGTSSQTLNNFIVIQGCISDCSNPVDIPHTGWQLVYTDSQESLSENGLATNAFDDDINTMWHTQYNPSTTAYPHEIQIDLGANYTISKFKYLPRQSGTNGIIANYEVYISNSTTNWGTAVATGTFANNATEKIVSFTAKDGRYLRFKALSSGNGNAFASAAEINVTGCITPACPSAQDISPTAWRLVSANSEQAGNPATNAFDGNSGTFWHTQYSPAATPYPHEIQIDMNASYAISKIKYLPRQDGSTNGRVSNYEIYISGSTSNWGTAVATGSMVNDATEKTISFTETTGRYIRFRALSEVNGNPWASAAEIKAVGCPTQTCPSANDNIVNDAFSSAVQIPLNTDMYGKITPSGDNDFYKFVITTGGTITLTLSTLPANYDVRLYNSAQTQVAISQRKNTASETINYTAAAGTYYVKIYGYNNANNAGSCYDLKVTTGTASFMKAGNIQDAEEAIADKKTIEVSPNPAKNILNIKLVGYNNGMVAKVFDMTGSMVLQKRVDSGNTAMDISKLSSGVYVIKFFNNDKQMHALKIVKE
jgi:PKD repeat protein